MCGIAGVITHQSKNKKLSTYQCNQKKKILTALELGMEERGTEGSGFGFVINKKVTILKRAKRAAMLIKLPAFRHFMNQNPQVAIGHTRWVTTGQNIKRNAHPFRRGKIVGVHNGVVFNHLIINNKVNVDSEVIFSLLNQYKNNAEKAFKRLTGSFAIVWRYAPDPNAVYLVVHDNPLWICRVPSLSSVFFCSTWSILQAVVCAVIGTKDPVVWTPKEDKVYRIDGKLRITYYPVAFKDVVVGERPSYGLRNYQNEPSYSGEEDDEYEEWPESEENELGDLEDDKPAEPLETDSQKVFEGETVNDKLLLEVVQKNIYNTNKSKQLPLNESQELPYSAKERKRMIKEIEMGMCDTCQQPKPSKRGFYYCDCDHSFLCEGCFESSGYKTSVLFKYISYRKYKLIVKAFVEKEMEKEMAGEKALEKTLKKGGDKK